MKKLNSQIKAPFLAVLLFMPFYSIKRALSGILQKDSRRDVKRKLTKAQSVSTRPVKVRHTQT